MTDYKLRTGPYPLGAHCEGGGIRFSFVSGADKCGVILYDRESGKRLRKLSFRKEERVGNIHCKFVPDLDPSVISYQFYEGDRIMPDPYARSFVDLPVFGKKRAARSMRAGFLTEDFDWGKDCFPRIPYENCICYLLHVRGFTRHPSSGVAHKGSFLGVAEKIPYLKSLGITTVELQPAYEFLELEEPEELLSRKLPSYLPEGSLPYGFVQGKEAEKSENRINYWGYKRGFYYAPKGGYASDGNPAEEFQKMVKAFHASGMEVVMQFYFPAEVPRRQIPDILLHWVMQYHVDGFHLLGEGLPVEMIASEEGLADTKLWFADLDAERWPARKAWEERDSWPGSAAELGRNSWSGSVAESKGNSRPGSVAELRGGSRPGTAAGAEGNAVQGGADSERRLDRTVASYRDDYMYHMRRFLKGDSDTLAGALKFMRTNPSGAAKINFFTNYYGFTMMDLVSYNEKHNEANGEHNRDGSDRNESWNCGLEGSSRRKQVAALRTKQYKNAMTLLFFSQGTPLIFMGDEFGNSQKGNNNPYCQDNEITWLNWHDKDRNCELFEFVADMIALRRKHPVLHQRRELRIMDYLSCGYPDLSYHGETAWRPSLEYYDRQAGMMYCGKYAGSGEGEDDSLYLAINMHWEPHDLALPKLPRGQEWELLFMTEESQEEPDWSPARKEKAVSAEKGLVRKIPPRTLAVYISRDLA